MGQPRRVGDRQLLFDLGDGTLMGSEIGTFFIRSFAMLIGYNNDVEHRGKTFHIQTEDRGANDDKIETQLFHGGAILDTNITSYTEIVEGLEGKERDAKIKSVMKASHRSLFKKLLAGKYDEMVGLDPVEKPEEVVEEITEDFQPGRDGVPSAAVELEEGGIEALEEQARKEGFADPAGQEHVDISKLKSKLTKLKKKSSGVEEEESEAETQILSGDSDALGDFSEFEFGSEADDEVELAATGVMAWTGCEAPEEDLSLTALVEESLAS